MSSKRALQPRTHAIRVVGAGLLRELRYPAEVCAAFDPDASPIDQHPPFVQFRAIWDTGATHTAITQTVVDQCGLKPTGVANVQFGSGLQQVDVFLVNVRLPNGPGFKLVRVNKVDLGPQTDMLIGMDIITHGDFSITNEHGKTVFSFRVPSQHTIDFFEEVQQHNKRSAVPRPGFRAPGHNNKRHK